MIRGSGVQVHMAPSARHPAHHHQARRQTRRRFGLGLAPALALLGASAILMACNASRFRSTKEAPASRGGETQPKGSPLGPHATPTDVGGGVLSQRPSEDERTAFFAELLAGLSRGLLGQTTGTTRPGESDPQTAPRDTAACTNRSDAGRPVDIVFNIDVSSSMNPYIAVIKNNVDRFVSTLGQKDADARVGAVGFVNRVEFSLEPTAIEHFRTTFGTWRTMDYGGDGLQNSDMQEAGQAGLEQSLFLLGARGRPNALKVLIHISDALAFAGTSRSDFSTSRLGEAMKATHLRYGPLLFFDSVPSTPGETGDPMRKVLTSFSPQSQMNGLRLESGGLEGSSLGFPFRAEAMTGEIPDSIAQQFQSMCQQQ